MKKYMLMGLLALGLLACAQNARETAADQTTATLALANERNALTDLYSGATKMVKTADCRYEVGNIKQCNERIELSIRKYSGYIASSNLESQSSLLEEKLTIRVANDSFDDLLREINSQAIVVDYQKVNTEDVAKQFVDLESRLRTKREVELRYTEILRKKAGTIEELLKAEQQIGALHEEIEATITRLNFLRDQIQYSTIRLELYQRVDPQFAKEDPSDSYWTRFSAALQAGLTGILTISIVLAYLWPILIFGIAIGYVMWTRKRRVYKKLEGWKV